MAKKKSESELTESDAKAIAMFMATAVNRPLPDTVEEALKPLTDAKCRRERLLILISLIIDGATAIDAEPGIFYFANMEGRQVRSLIDRIRKLAEEMRVLNTSVLNQVMIRDMAPDIFDQCVELPNTLDTYSTFWEILLEDAGGSRITAKTMAKQKLFGFVKESTGELNCASVGVLLERYAEFRANEDSLESDRSEWSEEALRKFLQRHPPLPDNDPFDLIR